VSDAVGDVASATITREEWRSVSVQTRLAPHPIHRYPGLGLSAAWGGRASPRPRYADSGPARAGLAAVHQAPSSPATPRWPCVT
jgi:hypothetical protein